MAVYFIRAGEQGPVKIGHALDPRRRLAMLQTGNASPLQFIRIAEGGRAEEIAAHSQFAGSRLQGEWFTFCEDMLTFGLEARSTEPARRRRPMVRFHPVVEELAASGEYSHQAVSQWRKRGVPYRVCCRAMALAMERGLISERDIDLAPFRHPLSPVAQQAAA